MSDRSQTADWRTIVESFVRAASHADSEVTPIWSASSSLQSILEVETALNILVPDDLEAVLRVSDGVGERLRWPGDDVDMGQLLWSTAQIRERNLAFRTDDWLRERLPVNNLLFFAGNGFGDSYAFLVAGDRQCPGDIIFHDHETDELMPMASSLHGFLDWWTNERKSRT